MSSFRLLTADEVVALKPLRVKIVTIGFRDTQDSMIRRMHGVDDPAALFQTINEIQPGAKLKAGAKVKIIAD